MPVTNPAILNAGLLHDMYNDSYFPDHLVKREVRLKPLPVSLSVILFILLPVLMVLKMPLRRRAGI